MERKEVIKSLISNNKIIEALKITIEDAEKLSVELGRRAILLKSRFTQFKTDKESGLTIDNSIGIRINNDISKLNEDMDAFEVNTQEVINSLQDKLLIDCSFPYVGRDKLRELVKKSIESKGSKMIFVKGEPKSGLSYIEKYLQHLSKKNDLYRIVSFHIPRLDVPEQSKGVLLAKFLSLELGIDTKLDDTEPAQFKFTKFTTKLRENLLAQIQQQTLIFFLHDFHRLPASDDVPKFIQNIAVTLQNNFPKVIFILSGFEQEQMPNWNDDLRFNISTFSVYPMESINRESFKDCLKLVFDNFKPKIVTKNGGEDLTVDEYIEGMLNLIAPLNKDFNLVEAGSKMKEHIFELKNL